MGRDTENTRSSLFEYCFCVNFLILFVSFYNINSITGVPNLYEKILCHGWVT